MTIKNTQLHSFFSVLKLFNKYYWKSFFGPFFAFGFSFIIYAILGSIMGYDIMFPGIVAMIGMSQGLTGLPFNILELKQSVLLKRIGSSPIKTWVFSMAIISHFLVMCLLVIFWLMLWALAFSGDIHIVDNLFDTARSFFTFMYGWFFNTVLSISMGFAVAAVAKTPNQAQAIGMLLYFPSAFLSGQFLSPIIIASNDGMNYFSKALPFRYTTMYMQEGWSKGGNPFDLTSGFDMFSPSEINYNEWFKLKGLVEVNNEQGVFSIIKDKTGHLFKEAYDSADHITGLVYPYIGIFVALIFAVKKFSWSSAR